MEKILINAEHKADLSRRFDLRRVRLKKNGLGPGKDMYRLWARCPLCDTYTINCEGCPFDKFYTVDAIREGDRIIPPGCFFFIKKVLRNKYDEDQIELLLRTIYLSKIKWKATDNMIVREMITYLKQEARKVITFVEEAR